MRRFRQVASLVLLLLAVAVAAQPLTDPQTRWWAERGVEDLRARIDAELAKVATPEWAHARIDALLAETPRDWARIEMLADLHPPTGALAGALHDARAQDFSFVARTGRCAGCLWDAQACSVSTLLWCRLPLELTPLGDVAALARGGVAAATGAEVDTFDVALGAAGLTATVLIPLTGGTSAPLKAGTSLLRTGNAAGRVTPELQRLIRSADRATLRALAETVGGVRAEVGTADTLRLLRHVKTSDDAALIRRTAHAMGPRTVLTFEALGASRVARLAVRLSDEAIAVGFALGGTVLSLVSLLQSLAQSGALSIGRRLLRSRG